MLEDNRCCYRSSLIGPCCCCRYYREEQYRKREEGKIDLIVDVDGTLRVRLHKVESIWYQGCRMGDSDGSLGR